MSGPTTGRMDVDANDGATTASTTPPRPPSLGGALRAAAWDVYANSWRIVPWNLLWAAALVAMLWTWSAVGALPAVVVGTTMAVPTAALARLGALATRGRDVNLSDGLDLVRARLGTILAAGLVWFVVALIFVTNVASGLSIGGPVGWGLATLAAWGLAGTGAVGLAFWPLLGDPDRAGRSGRDLARVAGLLVLAHPRQLGALVLAVAVLLLVSTVLFAVLITVAIGFTVGVACRAVLPAADRLEARLAQRAAASTAPDPTRAGP